jgi:hypothetical protein
MEDGSVYPVPATASATKGDAAAPGAKGSDARNVHALRFFTPDPLDHCARALDVLRRMGFDFVSVLAQPTPAASFLVRLNFVPNGRLSPSVLANRVSGFIGVSGVEIGIV